MATPIKNRRSIDGSIPVYVREHVTDIPWSINGDGPPVHMAAMDACHGVAMDRSNENLTFEYSIPDGPTITIGYRWGERP